MNEVTQEMLALLRKCGDADYMIAIAAQRELAEALEIPARQAVLFGDTVGDIFEDIDLSNTEAPAVFPLDSITNSEVDEHIAYTVPHTGYIPQRFVSPSELQVNTFPVANAIDFPIKFAQNPRWDVVARHLQILEAGFVRKNNNDAWHTILSAANGRNLTVSDTAATDGVMSKLFFAYFKTSMRRNGGGNSNSVNSGRLTHLVVSPEARADMLGWSASDADDFTRREVVVSETADGFQMNFMGVEIKELDELGEGQEYQSYYEDVLGGTMTGSKKEISIGLDVRIKDSFVHPIKEHLRVFEDPELFRRGKMGFWGRLTHGYAVLNAVRTLLGHI